MTGNWYNDSLWGELKPKKKVFAVLTYEHKRSRGRETDVGGCSVHWVGVGE